MSSGHIIVGMA